MARNDNDRVNEILNLVYEIEGVTELALDNEERRDDRITILKTKVLELQGMVSALEGENGNAAPADGATPAGQSAEKRFEGSEYCIDDSYPQAQGKIFGEELSDGINRVIKDEAETDIAEAEQSEKLTAAVTDDADRLEQEPDAYEEKTDEIDAVSAADRNRLEELKKLFSINDKFRYRRELFGNSSADFEASLSLVSKMSRLYQAEDYFYNDLEWDAHDDEVASFMTKIEDFFASQNKPEE